MASSAGCDLDPDLASFENFDFFFLEALSAFLSELLPDWFSKRTSCLAWMEICFCSMGDRTLPPPRGKRGSSSLRRDTAGAAAEAFEGLGAASDFLAEGFVDVGLSDFDFLEGVELLLVLAAFAEEGAPAGASLRLRELIFASAMPGMYHGAELAGLVEGVVVPCKVVRGCDATGGLHQRPASRE